MLTETFDTPDVFSRCLLRTCFEDLLKTQLQRVKKNFIVSLYFIKFALHINALKFIFYDTLKLPVG